MEVIKVENLTKEFRILHRKTMFKRKFKKLLALNNISFSVDKGDFIGIVGLNGAGKTTLLRILANILKPTFGNISVKGMTIAFLEMGVGFHEDLTVSENINFYGSLIGLSQTSIRKTKNKIISFSGLQKFADVAYKDLSQGMGMRLAFSVIAFTNPDIFLIDEGLAVGDENFRIKCYQLFGEFKKQKKTLLLVSHNLKLIEWFCDKVLWLDNGKRVMFDKTKKVLRSYRRKIK